MNATNQPNKFLRFLKNNAALLLIIFCVLAIGTVVLAVGLTRNNTVEPDSPVVVDPDDGKPTVTPDEPTEPTTPKTELVKVYFAAPVNYTDVSMAYTDGTNELFVFSNTLKMWTSHKALDLLATEGSDVCAMYEGTVTDVDQSYGLGYTVTIDHGDNVLATYASLGEVSVVEGQTVAAGEKIGEVSTTASYEFSDGAHLHLEVSVDGKAVDPTPYVKGEIYREIEKTVTE